MPPDLPPLAHGRPLARRRFLVLGGAAGLTALAAACSFVPRDPIVVPLSGDPRPLHVPPLARSELDHRGRRVFDLAAAAASTRFVAGTTTPTWGFNGTYLGPTLRASRGEEVLMRVTNALDEATTVHWHGMHLPAVADGGPHQVIEPGGTWEPTWRIDQPAATLWYHPHSHGETESQVNRGLAGMFLIDDDAEAALALPRHYGVDDIPAIVQDRTFAADGTFVDDGHNDAGLLGDTLLVNGTIAPYLDVSTERVRLRLLNASSARSYRFALDSDQPFALVATDGGLLPAPRTVDSVQLTPGERAEVVVALRSAERIVLRSLPQDLQAGSGRSRDWGAEDTFDVLELRAASALTASPDLPSTLVEFSPLDPADAVRTRSFRLSGDSINGEEMDMSRIDFAVTAGSTEVWEVTNGHSQPHNFHVHDVRFQVLDTDGVPREAERESWKDTVYLPPDTTTRIVMRFGHHTDVDVPYMYHCHLLYHEDNGMMGQFVIVEPGGGQGAVAHPGHGH
ncbi:multicopper oxidase family protein [Pseudonocardia kunmingensis]|uniref:Multicopper oxidase CueO n=1 Tax=Pseudonocardia kunmingensis TaxID=630975 RepID=A0A543E393_9PSEU|nr:multicopper oxidase domain-containing protein [Pseudonocardia kunmingensis]TQM16058.1 cell division protein SufI [Pseudonocardia kunmingensis]